MNAEELKQQRLRLGSQAATQPEELLEGQNATKYQIISVEFKPLEDPDEPPELSLQSEQVEPASQTPPKQQQKEAFSPVSRSRTKSEDFESSIIGFLQKKIKQEVLNHRTRLLSEQITYKLTISSPDKN